jgi:hypothetical protein
MLVLDANILIRAVLGRRVRELLERYARSEQTEVTLFERPDSGHPPDTQTDVLLGSH